MSVLSAVSFYNRGFKESIRNCSGSDFKVTKTNIISINAVQVTLLDVTSDGGTVGFFWVRDAVMATVIAGNGNDAVMVVRFSYLEFVI